MALLGLGTLVLVVVLLVVAGLSDRRDRRAGLHPTGAGLVRWRKEGRRVRREMRGRLWGAGTPDRRPGTRGRPDL